MNYVGFHRCETVVVSVGFEPTTLQAFGRSSKPD